MKVLHICNDYSYSKVYKNLYYNLDKQGVEQVVYHPLRSKNNIGKNQIDFENNKSHYIYSKFLLKSYHRILFRYKINSLYRDILDYENLTSFDVMYPTTLFSDGALALKLHLKLGIPYIVAVRNTDVNLFLKYRPDLILLAFKILKYAQKIVFISEGLKRKFFSHLLIKKKIKILSDKTVVISNGIDDFWLKNIVLKPKFKPKRLNFIYIGRFDKNKNIITVINALESLRKAYPEIKLNLVGGGGNRDEEVLNIISKNLDWIQFHGYVLDKRNLLSILRQNDYFLMPSIFETFGLVFIEALSQGLPILYTKGQGVDGLFTDNVGEGVFPDLESVTNGILTLIEKPLFDFSEVNFKCYCWSMIANQYKLLFNSVIK